MYSNAKDMTLWIWPLLEVFFLVAATVFWKNGGSTWPQVLGAILCLLCAAFFMSLTLHVTAHEALHRAMGGRWHAWVGFGMTLLLGVSFRYYRIHHWNHHRHNNGIHDFSCTWRPDKRRDSRFRPKNFWAYGLLWPKDLLRLPKQLAQGKRDGYATFGDIRALLVENALWIAIGVLLLSNELIPIAWMAGYCFAVYWGWVFIAWHNYGQHLPMTAAGTAQMIGNEMDIQITSYNGTWYNALTHGNGLHAEHHLHPDQPTHQLRREPIGLEIPSPHLWAAFTWAFQGEDAFRQR